MSTIFMVIPQYIAYFAFYSGTITFSNLLLLGIGSLIYAVIICCVLSSSTFEYDPYFTGAAITTASIAVILAAELTVSISSLPPYFFFHNILLLLFMAAVGALGSLGFLIGEHPDLSKH